jgi:allophanate hydrolase
LSRVAYDPVQSATVVARLIAAGAVPIGKTNLDQFATGLNGTRSPYGAPACVHNRAYVSGGSSSGSAVAVAAGLVAFALGTDTAGSGRVPAAFNGLIGFKPTKGRWSTAGLVPACRSLIASLSLPIGRAMRRWSMPLSPGTILPIRGRAKVRSGGSTRGGSGCPGPISGSSLAIRRPSGYMAALDRLAAMGAELVEIDLAPLSEAACLLYDGPWVAERTAALREFLEARPEAFDPTVRTIVESGLHVGGVETFRGIYRLAELRQQAEAMWERVDCLCLPTAPTIYRLAEMRAAPIALNSALGLYTNFVNLLDMAAIAVPGGWRANGTGFGVTMIGPAWTDCALLDFATRWGADLPLKHRRWIWRVEWKPCTLPSSAPISKGCRCTGS